MDTNKRCRTSLYPVAAGSRKRFKSDEEAVTSTSPDSIDQFDIIIAKEQSFMGHQWTLHSHQKAKELLRTISLRLIKSSEPIYDIDPFYIKNVQTDGMSESWREATIIWYLEVAECLEFPTEFVESTMSLLDRYLSKRSCELRTYRVAAAAAVLITGKQHSQHFFTSRDLVKLCGRKFLVGDLAVMEKQMLYTVQWALNPYTAVTLAMDIMDVCTIICLDDAVEQSIRKHTRRILEISYSDYQVLGFSATVRAWGSILCATKIQHGQLSVSSKKRNTLSIDSAFTPSMFFQWRDLFINLSLRNIMSECDVPLIMKCATKMIKLWLLCMDNTVKPI